MIRFENNGKSIKSAPAEIKKNEDYIELQELLKNLKSQRTRFRAAFERLCAEGSPIDAADLKGLVKLPIARDIAERLVFRTANGLFGIFDPAALALSAAGDAGKPSVIPLSDIVTVAHPLDLFEAGQLSIWQKEIVARKIVQPFKQVFRELYVITPAELATRVFSNRFAGHNLISRTFSGLLSTRGWKADSGQSAELFKLFAKSGVKAVFELTEVGHFLTESDTVVTDRVEFLPYPCRTYKRDEDPRIPLADIPAKILSEVLRDVDLFVSVAQVAEGDASYYSSEAFVRRGELLRSIIDDLGLPSVRVEGHFAYVSGKLAKYRVHLGSAVIHIDPGNYLCVVPDRAAKKKDLFLPFADADDPKLSEVVSKVILLANDDKIKDESILAQIRRNEKV